MSERLYCKLKEPCHFHKVIGCDECYDIWYDLHYDNLWGICYPIPNCKCDWCGLYNNKNKEATK